jgi:hypothetical protein
MLLGGNSSELYLDNMKFKIVAIYYHKFKWWQFWKWRSKVDKYWLEVIKTIDEKPMRGHRVKIMPYSDDFVPKDLIKKY